MSRDLYWYVCRFFVLVCGCVVGALSLSPFFLSQSVTLFFLLLLFLFVVVVVVVGFFGFFFFFFCAFCVFVTPSVPFV